MSPSATGSSYSFERVDAATHVIDFISQAEVRVAVLHGERGSRRRELVRDWIIPLLSPSRVVYYADCEPYIPDRVVGPSGESDLCEALQSGAVVFLGRMDHCRALADREQQQRLSTILGKLEARELPGVLVLLITSRNLGQLLT